MDRRSWAIAEAMQKERLAWAEREQFARHYAPVRRQISRRGWLLGLALLGLALVAAALLIGFAVIQNSPTRG